MQSFFTTHCPPLALRKWCAWKTKEELYHKTCLTPRLPRVILKANSHSGQQDQRDQDARSSWDPANQRAPRETWNNAFDCRIPGTLLSTVEQQDTNRQNKVKKLIEKLKSQKHKESTFQDLSQTRQTSNQHQSIVSIFSDNGSILRCSLVWWLARISIVSKWSGAPSFPQLSESLDSFFAQVCNCSIDTELICRNCCAGKQFDVFFATVEVHRLLTMSFAA